MSKNFTTFARFFVRSEAVVTQHSTTLHNTKQYNTTLHNTICLELLLVASFDLPTQDKL